MLHSHVILSAMPRRGKRRGEARPANDVKCIDHVVTSDEDKGLDSDDEDDDQDYNVKNEDEVSSSTDDEIKCEFCATIC